MTSSRKRDVDVVVIVKYATQFRTFGRNASKVRKSVQFVRKIRALCIQYISSKVGEADVLIAAGTYQMIQPP